jgi:hypothetical protein
VTAPAQDPTKDPQQAESIDLKHVEEAFAAALASLLIRWRGVKASWVDDLVKQVGKAAANGDVSGFGRFTLDSEHAAGIVHDALTAYAATSAAHVVDEATAQGVQGVVPVEPGSTDLADQAAVAAALLAAALATSAGSEAVRVYRVGRDAKEGASAIPASTPADTQAAVREHLDSLTDAQVEYVLGGALTGAQNAARTLTLATNRIDTHDLILFASEVLDRATCIPCFDIHGTRLGDTITGDFRLLYRLYPVRGYIECLGRDRCRGTPVGVWQKRS